MPAPTTLIRRVSVAVGIRRQRIVLIVVISAIRSRVRRDRAKCNSLGPLLRTRLLFRGGPR